MNELFVTGRTDFQLKFGKYGLWKFDLSNDILFLVRKVGLWSKIVVYLKTMKKKVKFVASWNEKSDWAFSRMKKCNLNSWIHFFWNLTWRWCFKETSFSQIVFGKFSTDEKEIQEWTMISVMLEVNYIK